MRGGGERTWVIKVGFVAAWVGVSKGVDRRWRWWGRTDRQRFRGWT